MRSHARLLRWLRAEGPGLALLRGKRSTVRFRYESFGGIVCTESPPALAFVDRDFARSMDYPGSPLWHPPESAHLSAPTEVHYSFTGRCPNGCSHCYVNAGDGDDRPELDTKGAKALIDTLSRMGVFHLALGGGEAVLRKDLIEVAAYARERGIVPNLTTSGTGLDERFAAEARVFGRIHVSLDGVGETYGTAGRTAPGFEAAERAIRLLARARARVGVNCVLTREGFEKLEDLARYARSVGVREIELLRFKSAGRAREAYAAKRLLPSQARRLFPYLSELADRFGLVPRLDCSLVPMICWHGLPPDRLDRLGVSGCEAGNVLLGIRPSGEIAACSFAEGCGEDAGGIEALWRSSPGLDRFRTWVNHAPEPCASCRYLRVCKGGCHVIAEHVSGDFGAPDPECPFVAIEAGD